MDTKSKKFKYSLGCKALCLVMSTLMFALFVYHAVLLMLPMFRFEPEDFLSDQPDAFYSSYAVQWAAADCVNNIETVLNTDKNAVEAFYNGIREKTIEAATQAYLNKNAKIIRDELTYVAKNYRDGWTDDADGSRISDEYVKSIPDTPAEKQTYPVDPYASNAVQAAQKVLNYAKGQEFLKYAALVREDAFESWNENQFYYSFKDYDKNENELYLEDYTPDAEEAKAKLTARFDSIKNESVTSVSQNEANAKSRLKETVNILYYVKRGDTVLSNVKNPDDVMRKLQSYPLYYGSLNGKTVKSPKITQGYVEGTFKSGFEKCDTALICCVNESEITGSDDLAQLYEVYKNTHLQRDGAIALTSLILAIGLLVSLLCLAGKKTGAEAPQCAWIDRLPGDVHTLISAGLFGGLALILVLLPEAVDETILYQVLRKFFWLPMLAGGIMWLILTEWLTSVVRTKKAGRPYFRNFLIIKLLLWVFRLLKKLLRALGRAIKNAALRYKPQHLKRKTRILLLALFGVQSLAVPVIAVVGAYEEIAVLLCLPLIALNIAVIHFAARYFQWLDQIIVAGKNRESAELAGKHVPESLQTLNDALRISNEEVREAVEIAVKNERTKAELITNVSHDLKTPLTSIISYVDLLKNSDPSSEEAQKYLEILGEKADNLKKLIENLVEASKVSAGNVQLNPTKLNLKELAIQAIVEFQPEFEGRTLDLRFNDTCEPVMIFADGQQTFRVLENLLSNAKKYSAPGTRVYASIREEGKFGVFEIKNISSEPLDISPEELTERFVRGDASRGREEGNGLGLSIAKELCQLQNGELRLSIDGDLFKAEVFLPHAV